ncbi:MAG: xylulose kinase [Actinobacteria bacterium]|nr:MAG: xylulose kinase [Actinomycetota bacterium]
MSGSDVTVGIDIGTTSVKAVAADGDGNVVARARVPHRLLIPSPDKMEHDAGQAWRRGPRRALAALGDVGAQAVCVASMIPSMCAVNRRGVPISPGLLYGDERGRTGSSANPGGSGETVAFLQWCAREYPQAGGYWPAPAVANCALAGEGVVDSMTAMAAFPLYTGTEWDAATLAEAGVKPSQMPRVEINGVAIGKVGDAVLGSSTVDAIGEQLVAGADDDGDVLVICGTTLIMWAVIPEWREVPGLWTVPHTAPGKILVGGASNAGGLFLNWASKLLGRGDRPADPRAVPVWVPYVRGERTPFHDPTRRASLADLDLTHNGGAARRAAFESAGFVVRHHLELAGVEPRRIVATGGGVRVEEWVQSLADCTGLPVDVVAVPEGGALGAAFQARLAVGLESQMSDGSRWARTARRVEPDPAWATACAGRYERFRELVG